MEEEWIRPERQKLAWSPSSRLSEENGARSDISFKSVDQSVCCPFPNFASRLNDILLIDVDPPLN
jgi:hypothetical protein